MEFRAILSGSILAVWCFQLIFDCFLSYFFSSPEHGIGAPGTADAEFRRERGCDKRTVTRVYQRLGLPSGDYQLQSGFDNAAAVAQCLVQ